jgi:hypothetical protein
MPVRTGLHDGAPRRRAAAERILAVDGSEAFLKEIGVLPGAETLRADVAEAPPRWPAANVVFCRFVLGHLPEPEEVLRAGVASLAPGGVVLAQEQEWIVAEDPVVARYVELVEGWSAPWERGCASARVSSAACANGRTRPPFDATARRRSMLTPPSWRRSSASAPGRHTGRLRTLRPLVESIEYRPNFLFRVPESVPVSLA